MYEHVDHIHNYFQTKEEIFLALLKREYEYWVENLDAIIENNDILTKDTLADALAHSLEKRTNMLKLLAMNLYDIEENSRLEALVEFKTVYGNSMAVTNKCLE
jgi:AcrR family transcriptional regulator